MWNLTLGIFYWQADLLESLSRNGKILHLIKSWLDWALIASPICHKTHPTINKFLDMELLDHLNFNWRNAWRMGCSLMIAKINELPIISHLSNVFTGNKRRKDHLLSQWLTICSKALDLTQNRADNLWHPCSWKYSHLVCSPALCCWPVWWPFYWRSYSCCDLQQLNPFC